MKKGKNVQLQKREYKPKRNSTQTNRDSEFWKGLGMLVEV